MELRFAKHPLYAAVAAQDHARFAAMAMAERKIAHLPPYTFLALLRAEAKSVQALCTFMAFAFDAAREIQPASSLQVWDPVAAPLSRKAGFERMQLMVQAGSRAELQNFLTCWLPMVRSRDSRAVKWLIDVDPLDV